MKINVVSLFPEFIESFFGHSIIGRAREAGYVKLEVTNPRDFTYDKHHQVDDTPCGGGGGMLLKAEPIFLAVEHILPKRTAKDRVILLAPTGPRFSQEKARELAEYENLVIICGHYEGVDYRVEEYLVDETISIGDYVLTGGELASMVVSDAVCRMIPGVLSNAQIAIEESFYAGLLEYPQYTKPAKFREWEVPEVLLSGHHAHIDHWRRKESLRRTLAQRPDLLQGRKLAAWEEKILFELKEEAKL